MQQLANILNEIEERLNESKSLEVAYENDTPIIKDVKGIVKYKVSKNEVKGIRKRKGKVKEKTKKVLLKLSEKLIQNKTAFKIIIWPKVVELRFDLDRFISIYDKEVKIAGFTSKEEEPLSYIYNILETHGKIVFLKPLK